ncbi:MAG: hypothetical protein WC897_03425 [Candidatus Gracilibacteria bacterium]
MIIDSIAFRDLLDEGEKIVYVAHVHPFKVYPVLFKVLFFGILVPALAYILFPPFYAVWIGWAGLGTALFIYRLTQWYLDAWIVTDLAIVKQEWHSFFDKNTSRIEYGNIEGITNETKGFWGTVMSFGNIRIDHMSGTPFFLNHIASPKKLERLIIEHQQAFLEDQTMTDHTKLKELLTTLLRSQRK